jgi:hypothetical protein
MFPLRDRAPVLATATQDRLAGGLPERHLIPLNLTFLPFLPIPPVLPGYFMKGLQPFFE